MQETIIGFALQAVFLIMALTLAINLVYGIVVIFIGLLAVATGRNRR
jgi:hypothetical protein